MIIAVDGPAASGKGTLARRLAQHFGFAHLDTGLLYRATALNVLEAKANPVDPVAAEAAAKTLTPADLADPRLKEAFHRFHLGVEAVLAVGLVWFVVSHWKNRIRTEAA